MSHKVKPLEEQVFFITGASSGIGLCTAKIAAQKGAKVVLVSRNLKELNKIVKEIQSEGGTAIAAKADVGNMKQLTAARDKALDIFGTIDTWVNNAGTSIYGKLMDLDIEEEKKLFETNFWGIRNGCHLAVETLAKDGGVLINLGSEVSQQAIPLQGIYSATKHAVKAYTEALRIEIMEEELPIHVCLVRPTAINTPFAQHAANRLKSGHPKLPTPIYDPKVVAEEIVNCALHPQRDIFAGASSKIAQMLNVTAPALMDKMLLNSFNTNKARGKGDPSQEALYSPPAEEGQIHGDQYPISKERSFSGYTKAASHPWTSLLGIVGLSLATIAFKKSLFK